MTTLTTDQKVRILRDAQTLLRERGWRQFSFCDPYHYEETICANGALARASGLPGRNFDELAPTELLEEVVTDLPMPHRPCMGPEDRICVFNNHEAKTVEDVIAQFQITIDRLERERAPRDDRELVAV